MEMLYTPEFWGTVLAAVLALQGLAVAITKMTPSPRDDEYVAMFYRVVFKLAAMCGVKPGGRR